VASPVIRPNVGDPRQAFAVAAAFADVLYPVNLESNRALNDAIWAPGSSWVPNRRTLSTDSSACHSSEVSSRRAAPEAARRER
jgi:hypothetical protein